MPARKNKRRDKGAGSIYQIGKKYYLQTYVNGKKIKKSLRTENKQVAEEKAKDLLSELHSKTKAELVVKVAEMKRIAAKDKVKLDEAWEMFKKSPLRNQSTEESTLENYENSYNKFIDWKNSAYPNMNSLSEITISVASEFADYLWNTGLTGVTFNRHIKDLRAMTKVLMKTAELTDNVWTHVKSKPENGISKNRLTIEEIGSLLDGFSDIYLMQKEQMEILFYIGIFTGMRLVDCAMLEWESVFWDKDIISLIPRKNRRTKKKIKVPIHPELRKKLIIAGEKWGYEDYVLPDVADRYQRNKSGVKKDAVKVFSHAGFEVTVDPPEGSQRSNRVNQYGFHSLRHTFICECASGGMSVITLSEMTGDTIRTLEKYYIEIKEEAIKDSVKFLPEVTSLLPPVENDNADIDIKGDIVEQDSLIDNSVKGKIAMAITILNTGSPLTVREAEVLDILQAIHP